VHRVETAEVIIKDRESRTQIFGLVGSSRGQRVTHINLAFAPIIFLLMILKTKSKEQPGWMLLVSKGSDWRAESGNCRRESERAKFQEKEEKQSRPFFYSG
jgi:hypothetical protein